MFAPGSRNPQCFTVLNISPEPKTIRIFQYPINYGCTRDLLAIPGVAEGDIRASLLKGELKHKINVKEIIVICSDIDLLQFNAEQLAFLRSAGIVNGLTVPTGNVRYLLKQRIGLIGPIDGVNRSFTVPSPDKFLDGIYFENEFHIYVSHNGNGLKLGTNFSISESGGPGTGYDTVNLISFTPQPGRSLLEASYVILAS